MTATMTPTPTARSRSRRTTGPTIEQLKKQGTDLLREFWQLESRRTPLLQSIAKVVVDLRSRFLRNGEQDWAGRSAEYRAAVASMYADAGIPTDSVAGVQAALRYHIGNELRQRLNSEQLAQAGLGQRAPRERAATAAGKAAGRTAEATKAAQRTPEQHLRLALDSLNRALLIAVPTEERSLDLIGEILVMLRNSLARYEQAYQQVREGMTVAGAVYEAHKAAGAKKAPAPAPSRSRAPSPVT